MGELDFSDYGVRVCDVVLGSLSLYLSGVVGKERIFGS